MSKNVFSEFNVIHTAIGCECNCYHLCSFLGKTAVAILSESCQSPPKSQIPHGGITGIAQACKHCLTFQGMATDSESSLHSTHIHATMLPPKGVHSTRSGCK